MTAAQNRRRAIAGVVLGAVVLVGCGGNEEKGARSIPAQAWTYSVTDTQEEVADWSVAYDEDVAVVHLQGIRRTADATNRVDGIDLVTGDSLWISDIPAIYELLGVAEGTVITVSDIPVLVDGRGGQQALFLDAATGDPTFEGPLLGQVADQYTREGIFTIADTEVRRVDPSGDVLWVYDSGQEVRHASARNGTVHVSVEDGPGSTAEVLLDLGSGTVEPWFTVGDNARYLTAADVIIRQDEDGFVERLDEWGKVLWAADADSVSLAAVASGEVVLLVDQDDAGPTRLQRLDPESGKPLWEHSARGQASLQAVEWIAEEVFANGSLIRSLDSGEVVAENPGRLYSDGGVLYGLNAGLLTGYGAEGVLWDVPSLGAHLIQYAPELITSDENRLVAWRN